MTAELGSPGKASAQTLLVLDADGWKGQWYCEEHTYNTHSHTPQMKYVCIRARALISGSASVARGKACYAPPEAK